MIEEMTTVISAIIGAAMRSFRWGGKTGASNRETDVNQRSGDASTQVVSGDNSTVNVGPANVNADLSNPVLTPVLPWYDCPHLRPEHASLDEIMAVSAFWPSRLVSGANSSRLECINPGCNHRCYRTQVDGVLETSRRGWCEQDGRPGERLMHAWRMRGMITELPDDDPFGKLI